MSIAVITIGVDELLALIRSEVKDAIVDASRQAADKHEHVSATTAARMMKKRTDLVLSACGSGALKAMRHGKSWSIRIGDLDAWAASGFPA